MATRAQPQVINIKPPNMGETIFKIVGTAPLVIHRFDEKTKREFELKVIGGSGPTGKKKHEATSLEDLCEAAKYVGETDGVRWEGFNASAIRNAMISACRLVNFRMTLAKLSIFVVEDGRDVIDPLIPLVRIHGDSRLSESIGRTSTDVAMLIVRPMYFPWEANLHMRFDADQFSLQDIMNLLLRVGEQVGICEGRPDSKASAGMGWGLFTIA
jgi:hypothetical protein